MYKQVFSALPISIEAGGVEIPIKWDFRASISFEEALQNQSLTPEEQLQRMVSSYFNEESAVIIFNLIEKGYIESFMNEIMNFYRCGKNFISHEENNKPQRPLYLFSFDSDMIYSAFYQQYGIDLYTIPSLHWWKFRAMFSNLSADCEIVRVMQIRSREITPSMSAKEKRELRKAKATYALPDIRSDEQVELDFAESFSTMF